MIVKIWKTSSEPGEGKNAVICLCKVKNDGNTFF